MVLVQNRPKSTQDASDKGWEEEYYAYLAEKEVKATTVLELPLDEYSMKVRTGPPIDDFGDFTSPAWAGVIPLGVSVGEPEPEISGGERSMPPYVSNWKRG